MPFKNKLKVIRRYIEISDPWEIARRAFVNNSFDGILTSLGIIIGAWLAGLNDPRTLLLAGMGAAISMGVSGSFGAFLAESAVRKAEITEIEERVMLEEFPDDTDFDKAAVFAAYLIAVVDGMSPFLASVICFLPFILGMILNWEINLAYFISIVLTALCLFSLGIYLGRLSRENILFSGSKLILAGLITTALIIVVEYLTSFV